MDQSSLYWTKVQSTDPLTPMLQTPSKSVVNFKSYDFPKCDADGYRGKKFHFRLLSIRTSGEDDVMARNMNSYYVQTLKVSSDFDKSFMGCPLWRLAKNRKSIRGNLNLSQLWRVTKDGLSLQSDRKSQDLNNARFSTLVLGLKAICFIVPTQRVVKHGSHASLSNSLFCARFAAS